MSTHMKRMTGLLLAALALASAGCSPSKPPETPQPVAAQNTAPASAPTASAGSSSPEQAGQASAEAWLALMDAGKYGESWTQASTLFKNGVDQKAWEKAATTVRTPLGKLESRSMKSRMFTKTIPGAPDGEYLVIKFDASFEHMKAAIETITPMKEADGSWKVSGYFIK